MSIFGGMHACMHARRALYHQALQLNDMFKKLLVSLRPPNGSNKAEGSDDATRCDTQGKRSSSVDLSACTPQDSLPFLLRKLNALKGTNTEVIRQAIALLHKRLRVDLISLAVYSASARSFTIVHTEGEGCHVVKLNRTVLFGSQTHSLQVLWEKEENVVGSAMGGETSHLPDDWQEIHATTGLTEFISVPILGGTELIGAVCVAHRDILATPRNIPAMEIAAGWLLGKLKLGGMTSIVHCMEQFLGCRNLNALVKTVAKGILKHLDIKFHVVLACRIALTRSDAQTALVFEDETISHHRRSSSSAAYRMTNGIIQFPRSQILSPHDFKRTSSSMESRRRIHRNDVKDLESDFLGHKILLKDTVLGESLRSKVPKYITDVTSYCQVPSNPCRDIFVSAKSQNISSLVLVPLITEGEPLGGVYVVSTMALNPNLAAALRTEIENALSFFAPKLLQRLSVEMKEEWLHLQNVVLDFQHVVSQPEPNRRSSLSKVVHPPSRSPSPSLARPRPHMQRVDSPSNEQKARRASDTEQVLRTSSLDDVDELYRPRRKSMSINLVKDVSPHHLGPMVRGIWDRLRENSTLAYDAIVDRPEDLMRLEVVEEIGSGGYGNVYRGTWNGLEVAVKVISIQDDNRSLIRQAMEVAIMSTVAHPYILQGLTAFTDVVRVDDGSKMRFVQPDAAKADHRLASMPRCCVLCMEFCEKGSLVDAIQSGAFRTVVKGGYGSSVPSLCPIYQTLLEIAVALRLLHSMKLVHCDIKPDNILLKSSSSDARGFQTRLSDFGTMKISEGPGLGVDTDEEHRGAVEGTLTHLPPEILNGTGAIGDHIDIYAFGILMWELYASMPVYIGLSKEQIVHRVVNEMLRPHWPADTPERYRALAEACWSHEIDERPRAEDIVYVLNALVTKEGDAYHRWKAGVPSVDVKPIASKNFNMHSTWCKEEYPLHIL